MIAQERQALINAVVTLCDRYPHWRLGQLLLNVSGWADVELWDVEDEQLLVAALAHLKQLPDQETANGPFSSSEAVRGETPGRKEGH